jgi:hypothetical protein
VQGRKRCIESLLLNPRTSNDLTQGKGIDTSENGEEVEASLLSLQRLRGPAATDGYYIQLLLISKNNSAPSLSGCLVLTSQQQDKSPAAPSHERPWGPHMIKETRTLWQLNFRWPCIPGYLIEKAGNVKVQCPVSQHPVYCSIVWLYDRVTDGFLLIQAWSPHLNCLVSKEGSRRLDTAPSNV